MRMDRILANSGCGTRTEVKKWIRSGFVSVGGQLITDPSAEIPESNLNDVSVSGRKVRCSRFLYLCLNKPDRCLTALEDTRLRTVREFIPVHLLGKGIAPVGRLDYHTTGILLFTNDGELNHRLSSPKHHVPKSYTVRFSGPPIDPETVSLIASGMVLRDQPGKKEKLSPATIVSDGPSGCHITIYEGKTHQVKRMLAATGRSVISLHRHDFAGIRLTSDQKFGQIRDLTEEEIDSLKNACGFIERSEKLI